MISDHLAQALLAKVNKTRMVAERLLDLRLPDFSHPSSRAPSTMASPEMIDVFLRPGVVDYIAPTSNLNNFVQMGSAGAAVGAVVVQAMVVGGGRVAKGIYNWATKKVQPLYDHNGELIEFTAVQRPPLPLMNIEDEPPTPPQPATIAAPQVHDDDPHNDDQHNDDLQNKIDSFIAVWRY